VVADISFISLTKLMDKLDKLISYPYRCVFLIKPEFELSPNELNKGKVKNSKLEEKAIHKVTQYALALHYHITGVIPSPIKGNKLQNTEYLLYMDKK
jgi:23S rRNA (cytidine1920-2'-O)/16S rRNA (cytidine1409-2'-O)-methyltransferase